MIIKEASWRGDFWLLSLSGTGSYPEPPQGDGAIRNCIVYIFSEQVSWRGQMSSTQKYWNFVLIIEENTS